MGDNLDVEIADMDLIKQVFARQRAHFERIDSYVSSTCRVPGALSGVLSFVADDYGRACDDVHTGFENGEAIATACVERTDETKATMLATDRKQYESYAALERSLGHDVAPYQPPPGGGTLGPAGSSAPSGPGAEEKFKLYFSTYADRTKKVGEVLTYDQNTAWNRSGPNGADYLDMKYWAKRGVETGTDAVRSHYNLDYEPTHRAGPRHAAPLPGIPSDVGSTVKGVGNTINAPLSAINNGIGIVVAGENVQAAQDTHTSVEQSVDGPSNTSGIDWANNSGGGW